jgi:arginine/lysine/histidine transporter system substrate-binding protein
MWLAGNCQMKRRKNIMNKLKILTAVLVLALLVGGCAAPTPAPPPPTATLQPTASVPDTSWQKIQQAGVLRVGTTADYPPFEYYNQNTQLDGFDIALIKQIAQRLGVQIQLTNYPFDSLPAAVAGGQVDAVIGAISVTPERQAIADFSNVYYTGEDGVLSRPEANPQNLQNPTALASARLGVQVDSVYQNYAQKKLIDTGLMPKQNLLVYVDTNQAVNELKSKQIDAVWLDLKPAQAFASGGGVKVLAQNLNQQLYAIGMMKGADTLRDRINDALTSLNNDGTLGNLEVQYLGIDPEDVVTPQPPPTMIPQPTPVPAGCYNNSQWVKDLSYDDNNHKNPPTLNPGQPFTKGWRIRNTGTCTWKKGYDLAFDYGNVTAAQMGGQPIPVTKDVKPNDTYDFQVNLVAPVVPGRYQGYWDMRDPQNIKFGTTVWVDIVVPSGPTVTPPPTNTPAPNYTFTATPLTVTEGSSVIFTWTTQDAKYVYFYHDGQKWSEQEVPANGQVTDYPANSMYYYLHVDFNDGQIIEDPIWINVNPLPEQAPDVQYVNADPPAIALTLCTTISWSVQGDAKEVDLLVDNTMRLPNTALIGNYNDCPATAGQHVYMIQASGPGGTDKGQTTVNVMGTPITEAPIVANTDTPTPTAVVVPPTDTPAPPVIVPTDTPVPVVIVPTDTPVPPPTEAPTEPPVVIQPPVIQGFTAAPASIGQGQTVTLAWTTGGGTTSVQLSRDGAVIWTGTEINFSVPDAPPTDGVTAIQYTLVASNNAGESVSSDVTVQVQ